MPVTPKISNILEQCLQDRNNLSQTQLLDQIMYQKCVQNSTQGGTLVFKLKNFKNDIPLNLKNSSTTSFLLLS